MSYLAGFTSIDGALSVIGMNGRSWQSSPKGLAFERDLYRVEGVEGVDPNDFEKDFSNLEGEFGSVLRGIASSNELPDKSTAEFRTLMDFMALTMVRGPELRNKVDETVRTFAKTADEKIKSSSPGQWAEMVEEAGKAGVAIPDDHDLLEKCDSLSLERTS